ncbi:ABC transporter permease [Paenibacillus sanguinis]|uniref:ABC transporter permease n=1 Tax=Paenibacillus sanguinis TaxID=225906 RepID=UPI00035DB05B|nr:ABC transporter permease [Paenibacillus sanguinis]
MMKKLLFAEFYKTRKICYIVPIVSAVVLILFTCLEWYLYFRQGEGGIYAGLNIIYMFLSFTMLLTISLLCSMVSETEHQSQGLKFLFATPVNRTAFYFAKAVWVVVLMLGCSILILGGFCLIWIMYTDKVLPFAFLVKQIFGCLAASFPILSIQLFLSLYFPNQTTPLGLGVTGAISSLFLPRITQEFLYVIPWSYPSMASPFIEGYTIWIAIGIALGLILLIAGALRFRTIEIK